jgi:hypothetical protein
MPACLSRLLSHSLPRSFRRYPGWFPSPFGAEIVVNWNLWKEIG